MKTRVATLYPLALFAVGGFSTAGDINYASNAVITSDVQVDADSNNINTLIMAYQPVSTIDGFDVFTAPAPAAIPPQIKSRPDHPLAPLGVAPGKPRGPLETNKFYANLMLGNQDFPAYLFPYSVSWTKGRTPTFGWGLTVSYVTAQQRVFGGTNGPCHHSSNPASFFFNPPVIQNVVLDAAELNSNAALTVENPTDMSVLVSLRPGGPANPPAIQFPLVQGQGFVTGLYNGSAPIIRSAMAILSVDTNNLTATGVARGMGPKPGVQRFVLSMNDNSTWLLYARNLPGTAPLDLHRMNGNTSALTARGPFYGSIQVARYEAADIGGGQGWTAYDRAAGVFVTDVRLSGHTFAQGQAGTYNFTFQKADPAGDPAFLASTPLLMFALPHHVASFDGHTQAAVQAGIALQTTTKGVARAVLADEWGMVESSLPMTMGFLPWDQRTGRSLTALSPSVTSAILAVAHQELSENMDTQTNLDSMYYSGKGLAKFAGIVLAAQELLRNPAAAADGLTRLKAAFAVFVQNRQKYPLVYEGTWGGVVSSASYTTGDPNIDFGNSYYNDHHFHYGYFVYAGAVIAHLDPSWLAADGGSNAAFVDALVRDYANPSRADPQFPAFRSFDWFHGHSWAHGLFPSMDGKDQESSSEDAMSVYALKLWGAARGDPVLEARGNLMLAVQARSLQTYYYYFSQNASAVEPPNFVGNHVGGIVFENKIDHTTYFGAQPEFIHGIHMLPLLPVTPYMRPPAFVLAEWNDTFAPNSGGSNRTSADQAQGGWRGVLYGNLATADPRTAYGFFSQPGFTPDLLDGGASRTWYLAYSAALGGS